MAVGNEGCVIGGNEETILLYLGEKELIVQRDMQITNSGFPALQVRYAATPADPNSTAKARGAFLRVSFKNTRETAQAINGMKLTRALAFLENVKGHKEAVPMRRYAGGTGRCAQGGYTFNHGCI